MLFPDETYEDYRKRIKSSTKPNAISTLTTSASYEGCRLAALQQSAGNGSSPSNKILEKFSKITDSSSRESATSTSNSSNNNNDYKIKRDFFDKIPAQGAINSPAHQNHKHISYKQQEHDFLKKQSSKDSTNNSKSNDSLPQPQDGHSNGYKAINDDLSTNPIFLRTCEAIIQHYRIRPDFFCQYYKAVRLVFYVLKLFQSL